MTAMNHQLRGGNADHIATPATMARAARTRNVVQRPPASLDHRRFECSGKSARVSDESMGVAESWRRVAVSATAVLSTGLSATGSLTGQ
ncbi:hypothetical protein GOSPT_022_02060 [Gordonia sputi NBRC 100414]|uniref:Uncharacterized protein n=1 Tax=Gordonia sputi NBRC 100414 TaxID=1089453 RepID=H5TWK2_9ACTN|nr:hypothetical protein GOSPT_022_02060 [Gordonia sputi NBRC 100414]